MRVISGPTKIARFDCSSPLASDDEIYVYVILKNTKVQITRDTFTRGAFRVSELYKQKEIALIICYNVRLHANFFHTSILLYVRVYQLLPKMEATHGSLFLMLY